MANGGSHKPEPKDAKGTAKQGTDTGRKETKQK